MTLTIYIYTPNPCKNSYAREEWVFCTNAALALRGVYDYWVSQG